MGRPQQHLTTLQVDIAGIFFALEETQGYLVAGGAALLARDLITRPTADLDLFTATPTHIGDTCQRRVHPGTEGGRLRHRRHPGRTHLLPDGHHPRRPDNLLDHGIRLTESDFEEASAIAAAMRIEHDPFVAPLRDLIVSTDRIVATRKVD